MIHGVVVLAAGRGERLGGVAKAGLRLGERSLLAWIVEKAPGPIIVVVAAPFAAEVSALADQLGVPSVENPAPERGMASSFAVGLAGLDADVAWAWPVDQPLVEPATLEWLFAAASRERIVIPTFAGRGGHPTGFGADFFPACQAAAGAAGGLRSVIGAHPASLRRIAVDDDGVVADVDTPADWEKMKADELRRRTP